MSAQPKLVDQVVPGRTLPAINSETKPFFDAAARGQLVIQRCVESGRYQYYPRPRSMYTYGEVEWVPVEGKGVIYSFTIVRMNAVDPVFSKLVPYCLALVDLPEGVRIMTNITGCPPEDVRIGMPVEVYFAPLDEAGELHMPFWRPVP